MPLTPSGETVKRSMQEHYGTAKGESMFYASMNQGKPGSSRWHRGKKKKPSTRSPRRYPSR